MKISEVCRSVRKRYRKLLTVAMKNLCDVPIDEQRTFLDSFEHIFCDMDGVIWLNAVPIPGAKECLINLKKIGKKLSFVSNNTLISPEEMYSNLKQGGFEDDTYTQVITPIYAIIEYLKSINFNKSIYIIATDAFKEELRKEGFSLVPDPPAHVDTLPEFLVQIQDDPIVGAVILDFDIHVNRLKLQKMLTYLKRKDCLFIAGICDKDLPVAPNIEPIIGNEHFAKCIAELSGRDYLQMSKPSPNFLKFLIDRVGMKDPKKILVIGDSIGSDMELAAEAGFQKLLVLTGSSKQKDLLNWKHSENAKPNYYIDGLERLKSVIENIYKI